ncbi:hypothetical protein [Candidatus Entotheonella palauensis]|uniref:Uncharacterized protein n=1 Tax=Candidatus Entotheonella gemina TaxID=1429439 RepID=W4L4K9_9BACT|nr:hypothetical protein [Candidatus Entotheonella palauensis]ETW93043.1 MAG: hypothetical protein ETSY2_52110 [Candidatus Entotheonella gemina]
MSAQRRVWCRIGILILITFLGSACTGGTGVQPVLYTTGPTEVDLKTRDRRQPARYAPPRHVSQYHHDATEVDLASPLAR